MPQLDYIIILSQIFWLFIILIILYTIILHFFLPIFLKSIRIRKELINSLNLEVSNLEEISFKKQNMLYSNVNQHLLIIKHLLNKSNFVFLKKQNSIIIDKKLSIFISNTIKFYNLQILNAIPFSSKVFNLLNK
uniref:ATP synthase F0 subunit 8 n=1 Tax=Plocamium cartilagineum TaxID=31452 RepID=A0A0E3DB55_PLOCA|nr:ATP synthase F0 subunit 8 [Plocamium cartilagineum]